MTGIMCFHLLSNPFQTQQSLFLKWIIPADDLASFLPVLCFLLHKFSFFSHSPWWVADALLFPGHLGIWPLTWGSIVVIDWLRPPANHPARGCWVMNTAASWTRGDCLCSICIYMEWLEMLRDEDWASWSGAAAEDNHEDDFDHI